MRLRRSLQVCAVVVAVGSATYWLAAGAHAGWTQTSVPRKTVDEVTGIEAIEYEARFVPGLDVLGAALLGAGLLAVASCFVPHSNSNSR